MLQCSVKTSSFLKINTMKKIILFGSPIIIMLEILIVNFIFELLRQPSDTAVLVGVTLICLFAFLNYLLINFIIRQFKTK